MLLHAFDNEPRPETYDAVVASKTVTPNAIKKLLAKAWCARQIMWPNRQNGILVEVGGQRLLPCNARSGAAGISEMDFNLVIVL